MHLHEPTVPVRNFELSQDKQLVAIVEHVLHLG